jgi:hypothetical protein
MITQQTFEIQANEDELAVIASVIDLIGAKNYDAALRVLISRHDKLCEAPKVVPYDPRQIA